MSKFSLTLIVLLVATILVWLFPYSIFFDSATAPQEAVLQIVNTSITTSTVATSDTNLAIKTTKTNTTISPVVKNRVEIQAWIYPGEPTCNAQLEYSDGRKIDILKPEYFMLNESGQLVLLTEEVVGCNGYSLENVANIKKYSNEQYVTFSSNYAATMDTFLTGVLSGSGDIDTIVSFVVANKMTGVEIDFEDFGGWNNEMYSKFKRFVTDLGNALHKNNKKLMVDGPATSNQVEENWYVWRYADFVSLPVDRLVIMAYDYQFDQGVGQPVSPISWIESTIKWTLSRYPYNNKISIGIPSYGYKGINGTQKLSLLTFDQIKREPGFATVTRDPASFEMTWQNGNDIYFYQDSQSMSKKLQTIVNSGVTSVSVWHLGGNQWFAKN